VSVTSLHALGPAPETRAPMLFEAHRRKIAVPQFRDGRSQACQATHAATRADVDRQGAFGGGCRSRKSVWSKKNRALAVKKLDTEVHQLKALSEVEYGSAAVAAAKRWGCPVGIIHYLAGRRPKLNAHTYATRRSRARQRGHQMPLGETWEHRHPGGRCFFWNHRVATARLQIGNRSFRWALKVSDERKAEALMAPVRVARGHLHRAAVQELNCALGTDAAVAAAAARANARAQFASAIITAGGPKEAAEFVLKGPQREVGADIPGRVGGRALIPRAQAGSNSIMPGQSGRHLRGPAPAAPKAPPCMWRGPGMELSDELYAQQPPQGPRGGRVGAA
jgi:hypothetical protein